jgi:hypothetical protein
MTPLILPALSADPARIRRSGLRWLRESGARVAAREPMAVCYIRLAAPAGGRVPLPEEQNDLQVVLMPASDAVIHHRANVSEGGYRDLVETGDWQAGEHVADAQGLTGDGTLLPLVLAGRRGFESGEGRGSLLAGWHERVRGFWPGNGAGERYGTVLSLGTCEQTAIFRGEDTAFLSWVARAPGPAQLIAVGDERCVHSSAVLLQHLRRTPAEALAMTQAVHDWVGERIRQCGTEAYPGLSPAAASGTLAGRWPEAQNISCAFHLLAEAVATSPILERTEILTAGGVREQAPADAIALTLGSELAPHFRHRKTGWIIAMHSFRFGPFVGPAVMDWLRRDFEPVKRTVDDMQRDLAALADEVKRRTGGVLVVQNLIASIVADRVSNYAWLGDAYGDCVSVLGNSANLMLGDLTRSHSIVMVDSDAMASELGVNQCPDRFHASGRLVEAQRAEVHRILRGLQVPGF